MKREMVINSDIRMAAERYVREQLAVMKKYGSCPEISSTRFDQLVYDCAKPAQIILNCKLKEKFRAEKLAAEGKRTK